MRHANPQSRKDTPQTRETRRILAAIADLKSRRDTLKRFGLHASAAALDVRMSELKKGFYMPD